MKKILQNSLSKLGYKIIKDGGGDVYNDIYTKYQEYTMIPRDIYCDNLALINYHRRTLGDIVECGVWRGGMIAGIANLLQEERNYYLFDSFEGLPKAKEIDGEGALAWQNNPEGKDYFNNCSAEMEYANKAMQISGVSNFKLEKGWFSDTLKEFQPSNPIAMLRLDGDWYDSTMDCLKYLYPLVTYKGLIIIDDYYTWDGCSRAVHDYLASLKSVSRIYSTVNKVCYIIKLDKCENE